MKVMKINWWFPGCRFYDTLINPIMKVAMSIAVRCSIAVYHNVCLCLAPCPIASWQVCRASCNGSDNGAGRALVATGTIPCMSLWRGFSQGRRDTRCDIGSHLSSGECRSACAARSSATTYGSGLTCSTISRHSPHPRLRSTKTCWRSTRRVVSAGRTTRSTWRQRRELGRAAAAESFEVVAFLNRSRPRREWEGRWLRLVCNRPKHNNIFV